MILAITPNVALDRTLVVPDLQLGAVLRPTDVICAAGGKGLNVALSLRRLGAAVRCCGLLGGHTGRLVADLAQAAGLDCTWTAIAGETRVCTMLVQPGAPETTGIYEVGPAVALGEWERFEADILDAARGAALASISGSLPAGIQPHALRQLIGTLKAARVPVWVDTSGAALAAAVAAQPHGIKVNGAEAGALLGVPIRTSAAAIAAARALQGQGVGTVVVTLGPHGAGLVDEQDTWWATPPPVPIVSPTGSGDAFLAGLLSALAAHRAPPDALRYAVAVGTANAQTAGAATFDLAALDALLPRVHIERKP